MATTYITLPITYNPAKNTVGTLTKISDYTYRVTNVDIDDIKSALNITTNDLETLCKSTNVNEYSCRIPGDRRAINNQLTYTVPDTDYSMLSFAGYNPTASRPSIVSCPTALDVSKNLSSFNFVVGVDIGEIDWNEINTLNNYVFVEASRPGATRYGYKLITDISYDSDQRRAYMSVEMPNYTTGAHGETIDSYNLDLEFWFGNLVFGTSVTATKIVQFPDSTGYTRQIAITNIESGTVSPTSSITTSIDNATVTTQSSQVTITDTYDISCNIDYSSGDGSTGYIVEAIHSSGTEVVGTGMLLKSATNSIVKTGTFSVINVEEGDYVQFVVKLSSGVPT